MCIINKYKAKLITIPKSIDRKCITITTFMFVVVVVLCRCSLNKPHQRIWKFGNIQIDRSIDSTTIEKCLNQLSNNEKAKISRIRHPEYFGNEYLKAATHNNINDIIVAESSPKKTPILQKDSLLFVFRLKYDGCLLEEDYTAATKINEKKLFKRSLSGHCDSLSEKKYFLLGMLQDGRYWAKGFPLIESFLDADSNLCKIFFNVSKEVLKESGKDTTIEVSKNSGKTKSLFSRHLKSILNSYYFFPQWEPNDSEVSPEDGETYRMHFALRYSNVVEYATRCEIYGFLKGIYLRYSPSKYDECKGDSCLIFRNHDLALYATIKMLLKINIKIINIEKNINKTTIIFNTHTPNDEFRKSVIHPVYEIKRGNSYK